MSEQQNKGGTATAPQGEQTGEAKQPRESRNNHKAAETAITSIETAQTFVDTVLKDTHADKQQSMFNSSGFTTPAILSRQAPANLLRMSVSIAAALAQQVAEDGETGDEAKKSLGILSKYAQNAGTLQENAKNQRAIQEAVRVLGLPANASPEQIAKALAARTRA